MGVIWRHIALQDPGPTGGLNTLRRDIVLYRNRYSGELSGPRACIRAAGDKCMKPVVGTIQLHHPGGFDVPVFGGSRVRHDLFMRKALLDGIFPEHVVGDLFFPGTLRHLVKYIEIFEDRIEPAGERFQFFLLDPHIGKICDLHDVFLCNHLATSQLIYVPLQ